MRHLEGSLNAALQKSESWHSDLTLWGDIDGDGIQLWRDHGKVESLQVRFDLRKPILALFQSVVDIARELGLAILALEMRSIVPLDPQELLHVAAESNAAEPGEAIPEPVAFRAEAIASPFFSVDVARRADGVDRIVEIGDGQVSDLVGRSVERFVGMRRFEVFPPHL
jgi:hypothetical protein